MAAKRSGARRTPYDPALDVIVHKFWAKQTAPNRGTRLVLRQYNGGEIKLAYEEVWLDKATGEQRSKVVRCPAKVLVEAGLVTPEITAAASVAEDPKPEPEKEEQAFEL